MFWYMNAGRIFFLNRRPQLLRSVRGLTCAPQGSRVPNYRAFRVPY